EKETARWRRLAGLVEKLLGGEVQVARIRRFFLRLYNLFRAAEADRELSRELDAHVALIEDDCRRRGLSPSQAGRADRSCCLMISGGMRLTPFEDWLNHRGLQPSLS